MRYMKSMIIAAAAIFAAATALNADVFELTNNRVVEGEEVKRVFVGDEEYVVVKTAYGEQKFLLADLIKKTTSAELLQKYDAELKKRNPQSADDHFQLGVWCKQNYLKDKAQYHFEQCLTLNPDHEGAKKALGKDKKPAQPMEKKEKDETAGETKKPGKDEEPKKEDVKKEEPAKDGGDKSAEGEKKPDEKPNPLLDASQKDFWTPKAKQAQGQDPAFIIKKPSEDWVFIDLPKHKEAELKDLRDQAKYFEDLRDSTKEQSVKDQCIKNLDEIEKYMRMKEYKYVFLKAELFNKKYCAWIEFDIIPKKDLQVKDLLDVAAKLRQSLAQSKVKADVDKKITFLGNEAQQFVYSSEYTVKKDEKTTITYSRIDCFTKQGNQVTFKVFAPKQFWDKVDAEMQKVAKFLAF